MRAASTRFIKATLTNWKFWVAIAVVVFLWIQWLEFEADYANTVLSKCLIRIGTQEGAGLESKREAVESCLEYYGETVIPAKILKWIP